MKKLLLIIPFLLFSSNSHAEESSALAIDELMSSMDQLMGGPTVNHCPECFDDGPLARTATPVNLRMEGEVAKSRCADSGGMFAISYGCERMNVSGSRACSAQVSGTTQNLRLVLSTEALKNTGDHRSTTFRVRMGNPYYYGAANSRGESEQNYLVKIDRDTSAEVQLIRQANGQLRLAKYTLYTKHVVRGSGKNKRRTFHEYACTRS